MKEQYQEKRLWEDPPENGIAYKWLNVVWLRERSDFHVGVIETSKR
jgi:hypothetical protein